jgi:hypothetical protein
VPNILTLPSVQEFFYRCLHISITKTVYILPVNDQLDTQFPEHHPNEQNPMFPILHNKYHVTPHLTLNQYFNPAEPVLFLELSDTVHLSSMDERKTNLMHLLYIFIVAVGDALHVSGVFAHRQAR